MLYNVKSAGLNTETEPLKNQAITHPDKGGERQAFISSESRTHLCMLLPAGRHPQTRIYSRPDGVQKRYSIVVGMAVCPPE